MSATPGLGAFNKDKVANKFGIQLKTKEATQQPSTPLTAKKVATIDSFNVQKNKTISDFRVDNNANGYLSNTNSSAMLSTSESTKKHSEKSTTNKSNSAPVNTSAHHERSHNLTTNVNHSTEKSKEYSSPKPVEVSKKSTVTSTEQVHLSTSPVKHSTIISTTNQKTGAQIEHQKDQPLYKRQLSKTLDNTSLSINKNATTPANASTTSLKR